MTYLIGTTCAEIERRGQTEDRTPRVVRHRSLSQRRHRGHADCPQSRRPDVQLSCARSLALRELFTLLFLT